MRNIFNTIVAVALVAASACFTACGDDKDEPSTPTTPDTPKTIAEATVTAALYVNQGVVDTYDVVVTDASGRQLTLSSTPEEVDFWGEPMPMYSIVLVSTGETVPVSAALNITYTLKDGYTVPERSDFAFAAVAEGKIKYSDGSIGNYSTTGFKSKSTGVKGESIEEYTNLINQRFNCINAVLSDTGVTFAD